MNACSRLHKKNQHPRSLKDVSSAFGVPSKPGCTCGFCTQVFLDVTCIMEPVHFQRFKRRQDEFRQVFVKTREMMQARYGAQGALGFDAYIHLLKAFAAKVPASALGGFQSVCIGLFTLQRGHFLLKPNQSIASSLFEGFLSFCVSYYGEPPASPSVPWHSINFRRCAIDLSDGGRRLLWSVFVAFLHSTVNSCLPWFRSVCRPSHTSSSLSSLGSTVSSVSSSS